MTEHTIGTLDDFPEGEGRAVEIDGIEIAVFNLGDGDLRAILNRCAHKQLPMHEAGSEVLSRTLGNVDAENCSIQCPWHHLEWDLETGHNPVLDANVSVFETVVTSDDEVVVTI